MTKPGNAQTEALGGNGSRFVTSDGLILVTGATRPGAAPRR